MNDTRTRRRTALLVEDDDDMLALLEHVLGMAGFDTESASRGQAALEALEHRRFDVLLIDVGLPDMNGLVIGDRARELYKNEVVIIVITGEQIYSRRLTSLELNADDFLGKPFAPEELIARIQSKLRRMDSASA
jgi:DNA-binding response OmpR family regulator